jgi:hypothetical protein
LSYVSLRAKELRIERLMKVKAIIVNKVILRGDVILRHLIYHDG